MVTIAWRKNRDKAAFGRAVAAILAQRHAIKHCHRMFSAEFGKNLMEAAAKAEYRHIFPKRRDEIARVVSQKAAGGWHPEMALDTYEKVRSGRRKLPPIAVVEAVTRIGSPRRHSGDILRFMEEFGSPHRILCHEDIYHGERAVRLPRLRGGNREHRAILEEKIFDRGRNTPSAARCMQNLAAVAAAVRTIGDEPPPGGIGSDFCERGPKGSLENLTRVLHLVTLCVSLL